MQAQQEVRQHWFIDSYIAAYIQVQYRVTEVHPTGLTVARGVGRYPQGSLRALASAGRRRGQRSNLCGGATDATPGDGQTSWVYSSNPVLSPDF